MDDDVREAIEQLRGELKDLGRARTPNERRESQAGVRDAREDLEDVLRREGYRISRRDLDRLVEDEAESEAEAEARREARRRRGGVDVVAEDEHDETPPAPPPKPKRRRRATTAAADKIKSRIDKRADAVKETLQELIRLRRPDLDVEGLTFVEVVDRDADAWGRFVAQLAEWFTPLGGVIDLVFGAPLMTLVGLAPSVRAARRDLSERRSRKKAERAAAEAEAAQRSDGLHE